MNYTLIYLILIYLILIYGFYIAKIALNIHKRNTVLKLKNDKIITLKLALINANYLTIITLPLIIPFYILYFASKITIIPLYILYFGSKITIKLLDDLFVKIKDWDWHISNFLKRKFK